MSAPPVLTVVIGANGAGKTTWVRAARDGLPKPFYNADSIAEGLGDANDPALQRDARQLVDQRIRNDLEARRTFGFESTYSGRSRPDIVRTAKRLGYATNAVFLGTDNPNINISRVRKRVSEGGHHVDDAEVRRRWTAAWNNLIATWGSFDTVEVLDNSGPEAVTIARKSGAQVTVFARTKWAQDLPRGAGATPTPSTPGQASRAHQAAEAAAARAGTPREREQRQAETTNRRPGRGRDD